MFDPHPLEIHRSYPAFKEGVTGSDDAHLEPEGDALTAAHLEITTEIQQLDAPVPEPLRRQSSHFILLELPQQHTIVDHHLQILFLGVFTHTPILHLHAYQRQVTFITHRCVTLVRHKSRYVTPSAECDTQVRINR